MISKLEKASVLVFFSILLSVVLVGKFTSHRCSKELSLVYAHLSDHNAALSKPANSSSIDSSCKND